MKWHDDTFAVQTVSGTEIVRGIVSGVWGIDDRRAPAGLEGGFALTHIPTGAAVAKKVPTQHCAKMIAEGLDPLGDWRKVKVEIKTAPTGRRRIVKMTGTPEGAEERFAELREQYGGA